MAEMSRIQLMKEQINMFWEKLESSKRSFSVAVFIEMLRNFSGRPSIKNSGGIDTIHRLRKSLEKETNRVRIMYGTGQVKWDPEILYFNWFMDFFEYLKELRQIYLSKIRDPLELYAGSTNVAQENNDLLDQIFNAKKQPGKSELDKELKEIRKELGEISKTYEVQFVQKFRDEIGDILKALGRLLDVEWDHVEGLFDSDSASAVAQLKPTDTDVRLIRLVPDLLLKFEKLVKLATDWIEEDSRKMQELPKMMEKLKSAERQLLKKLEDVSERIKIHEEGLAKESKQLENLLEQKKSDSDVNKLLFLTDREISRLQDELRLLSRERQALLSNLQQSPSNEDSYMLGMRLERNRFHQYALQRDLSARLYHKNMMGPPADTEADNKPTVKQYALRLETEYEYLEELLARRKSVREQIERELQGVRGRDEQRALTNRADWVRGSDWQRLPAIGAEWRRPLRSPSPPQPPRPAGADRFVHLVYMPPTPGRRAQSLDGRYVQMDFNAPNDRYKAKLQRTLPNSDGAFANSAAAPPPTFEPSKPLWPDSRRRQLFAVPQWRLPQRLESPEY